jgi:hypothetical protein
LTVRGNLAGRDLGGEASTSQLVQALTEANGV